MNFLTRGLVALSMLAAVATATPAVAQQLEGERAKVSYMVGMDVAGSVRSAGPDLDLAAFRRAVENAFEGGQPLISEAEAQTLGPALVQRIAVRSGKPVPGMAPGAEPPEVSKEQVGYLVGGDVGRSLAPIKDEIDMEPFLEGVRVVLDGGEPRLTAADAQALRASFSARVQSQVQAKAAEEGRRNATEGAAFLAKNGAGQGVVTTPSGLQYRVLRQGAGPRPLPTSKVRVHYHGTLLDGTVFDSSYERGRPAEFGLDGVIAGWTEGVGLMPVGGKYRFWIPASLAYGEKGSPGSIPPNATLVFDVELLQVL